MARNIPNFKLQEAKQYVDNLDDSKENILIKYYIQKNNEHIEEQNKRLKAYKDWFEKLDSFLPSKKNIIF